LANDSQIKITDTVVMGDINQTISGNECPGCFAANVRVMMCQISDCETKFCELCHAKSRFSEGHFERFDSGHGSGPFCAKCLISTNNQYEEKKRLERERVERERIERERVEVERERVEVERERVERERVERERIEEEEKELADRRVLVEKDLRREEKKALLISVPLFWFWVSFTIGEGSLFIGCICSIPLVLLLLLNFKIHRNKRIKVKMKITN
jgi:hypothetical protein